jgi:hypothetical protein
VTVVELRPSRKLRQRINAQRINEIGFRRRSRARPSRPLARLISRTMRMKTNKHPTNTVDRPRGRLLRTAEARTMIDVGESTFLGLMKSGYGPPGFRRPGSNRWLFWEGELLDWLESNRRKPAA